MRKYTNVVLFGLLQFPLLCSVFLLNYNDLNNIFYSTIFWSIIVTYICIILMYYVFTRIFKSITINKYLEDFSKNSLIFIFLLVPGLSVAYYFLNYHQDSSNLLLRVSGRVAFFYMAISLSISPLITILKGKWSNTFISIRKYTGILSFLFFVKHGMDYILIEYGFYDMYYKDTTTFLLYFIKNLNARTDVVLGLMGGALMTLLGITSNNFSYQLLGKLWKSLHAIVYPAFLIAMVHIAFAGRYDEFYAILFTLVVGLRFFVYIRQNKSENSGPTTKYICVVCGYIYDELIGDPDSGIAPGTKFEDIPDDWKCPICGVTKSDFIPYYDNSKKNVLAEIVSMIYLTKDVVEFTIKLSSNISVVPGQFMKLIFKDFDGEFNRSYSVAKVSGNEYTFLIKVSGGRGGRVIKTLKVGDKIGFGGVFGNFILQNTSNKKVFIATGTGLSPIYHMIMNTSEEKELFFGVRNKEDLFYEQQLSEIEGLKVNYYLSGQEIVGYNYGRISIQHSYDIDTEFYICGSPQMVQEIVDNLMSKGYKHIYFEKFL